MDYADYNSASPAELATKANRDPGVLEGISDRIAHANDALQATLGGLRATADRLTPGPGQTEGSSDVCASPTAGAVGALNERVSETHRLIEQMNAVAAQLSRL